MSIKIIAPMVFEVSNDGTYNLNERYGDGEGYRNETEHTVVKLELLKHLIDQHKELMCCNGDLIGVAFAKEIEALTEKIWDKFEYFMVQGINIFEYADWYTEKQLAIYNNRPCCQGHFNASPEEKHEGLPEGWWYDFPGHANKWFSYGRIVIDADCEVRIGLYDNEENDNPIDFIVIESNADFAQVFTKYPDCALEIVKACEFIANEYKI